MCTTTRLMAFGFALALPGPVASLAHAQWEYRAVKFAGGEKAQTEILNTLAADGWEYVGPLVGDTVCFRRMGLSAVTKEFLLGQWQGKVGATAVKIEFRDPEKDASRLLLEDEKGSTDYGFNFHLKEQPGNVWLGATEPDGKGAPIFGVVRLRKDGVLELRLGPSKAFGNRWPEGVSTLTRIKK